MLENIAYAGIRTRHLPISTFHSEKAQAKNI